MPGSRHSVTNVRTERQERLMHGVKGWDERLLVEQADIRYRAKNDQMLHMQQRGPREGDIRIRPEVPRVRRRDLRERCAELDEQFGFALEGARPQDFSAHLRHQQQRLKALESNAHDRVLGAMHRGRARKRGRVGGF